LAVESFPSLPMAAVALDPEGVEYLLRGPSAPELKDRVEFGGPIVTPIGKDYRPNDDDLQAFIRGQADRWRFVLAHMSINFPPSYPPPLTRAGVQVSLDDDANTGQTVAYSLFPTHAGTSYDVTQGFSISPTLTVGPVTAAPGSVGKSTTDHGTRDFVVGGPELSAHPVWNFQRTSAQELLGSSRLILVIQVPVGRTGVLTVDVTAGVEQGRWRKRQIPLPAATGASPRAVNF
jgi:hypothetical protein